MFKPTDATAADAATLAELIREGAKKVQRCG
jgi:hypothetical protein